MAEGTIIEVVVSKTQIRQFKYFNCRDVRVGNVLECLRRACCRLSSSRTLVGNSSCEVIKTSSQFHEVDQESCGFRCFSYFVHGPPWALKTRTSKSHVAMRANEPAILLAEAMGQFRCFRDFHLQSFTCRRKIVSIHFSYLLLNSTPHTAGGKRARNAPDAGGARCAHAANRYTRNTHAGKIGGCKEFKIGKNILTVEAVTGKPVSALNSR
jgi:hypothetical protein